MSAVKLLTLLALTTSLLVQLVTAFPASQNDHSFSTDYGSSKMSPVLRTLTDFQNGGLGLNSRQLSRHMKYFIRNNRYCRRTCRCYKPSDVKPPHCRDVVSAS